MLRGFTLYPLLLICLLAEAQSYRIDNYTVENGLSQSQVLEVIQDNSGEIWIGTANGGISIFDGLQYRYITRQEGLPSNTIYDLELISETLMAVATFEGLAIIDIHNPFKPKIIKGIPDGLVYKIFKDGDRIILGTGKGICYLEDETIIVPENHPLLDKPVFNICRDGKGRIWYCTLGYGAYYETGKNINRLSEKEGLGSNNVNCVFDFKGKTCVGTYAGVFVFETEVQQEETQELPFKNEIVFDAVHDVHGHYWLGTHNGLFHINGEAKLYDTKDGLVGKDIGRLIEDREGNIWCGSREGGLSKVRERIFTTYTKDDLLRSNGINRIKSFNGGKSIWIATDKGITVLNDDNSNTYIDFTKGLPDNRVRAIEKGNGKEIYIGTAAGLAIYDGSRFKSIKLGDGVNEYIQDICLHNDTIFAGTYNGLARLEGSKLLAYPIKGLSPTLINQLLSDGKGGLWISTNESGLYFYKEGELHQFTEIEGFTAKTVKSIYLDDKGMLWAATNSGLFLFKNSRFYRFSSDNGLGSNAIVSIIQQDDSTYWAGLNKGTNRFVLRGESIHQVRLYSNEHGFSGQESNPRAIYKGEDGRIWFGTNGGLNIYHPDRDHPNLKEPIVKISALLMFMQATDWNEYADEFDLSGLPMDLVLAYDKNNISFVFKGVSQVSPENVKYRYRLIGEHNDWIETSERRVDYSNLSHGTFTFEVQAANSDGVWSSNACSFTFSIDPPFWKTWWFYFICVSIVFAGIFSYFKIRNANTKITEINQILSEQKDIIYQKNKDIMDSIHYAKRIQDAVLPPPDEIDLPKTFIFFRPRDVVSGDFYWFYNKGNLSLFAVADCTGHGVPGAFMSIIGYNLMDKIVGEHHIYEPAAILERLSEEVSRTLNKRLESEGPVRDGMDISVCCFHRDTEELEYAGAVHPLIIWRDGNLQIIKGDRISIGKNYNDFKYTNHKVQLHKGDMLYLYTDGFIDQFGGDRGKKYKSLHFREFIERVGKYPVEQQSNMMIREFESWKGKHEQVDDVLVLGTLL
jgi:ligand-binding sensor domain-containing protein/serine phosphatase RsbU (regulator of sigma subunit)